MALENGSYINQLDEASPDGLDPKSQGDDHLRLIKKVLKLTFSKITGPVTVNHEQLNSIALPGALPVRGMIMLWQGSSENCPEGWAICDGSQGTPDLRDKFVRGAGGSSNVLAQGGTDVHSHGLTITTAVQDHTLTAAQIPPHSHTFNAGLSNASRYLTASYPASSVSYYPGSPSSEWRGGGGGGQPHTHGATSSGSSANVSHIPPFVALFYIMKL